MEQLLRAAGVTEEKEAGSDASACGSDDLVLLCDGSHAPLPSGALPSSSANWRQQLAASSVAPLLLSTRSRARLPAPELLWRWAVRGILSEVAPMRKASLLVLGHLLSSVQKRALEEAERRAAAGGKGAAPVSIGELAPAILQKEAPSVHAMFAGEEGGAVEAGSSFPWVSALVAAVVQSLPEASAGAASGSASSGPQSYGSGTGQALVSQGVNIVENCKSLSGSGFWGLLPAAARGSQIDAGGGGGRRVATTEQTSGLFEAARVCFGEGFGRQAVASARELLRRAGGAADSEDGVSSAAAAGSATPEDKGQDKEKERMGIGEKRACSATAAMVFGGLARAAAHRGAVEAGWRAGAATGASRPRVLDAAAVEAAGNAEGTTGGGAASGSGSGSDPVLGSISLPDAAAVEESNKGARGAEAAAGKQTAEHGGGAATEPKEGSWRTELAVLAETLLVPGLEGCPLGWAGDWASMLDSAIGSLPAALWEPLATAVVGRTASCLLQAPLSGSKGHGAAGSSSSGTSSGAGIPGFHYTAQRHIKWTVLLMVVQGAEASVRLSSPAAGLAEDDEGGAAATITAQAAFLDALQARPLAYHDARQAAGKVLCAAVALGPHARAARVAAWSVALLPDPVRATSIAAGLAKKSKATAAEEGDKKKKEKEEDGEEDSAAAVALSELRVGLAAATAASGAGGVVADLMAMPAVGRLLHAQHRFGGDEDTAKEAQHAIDSVLGRYFPAQADGLLDAEGQAERGPSGDDKATVGGGAAKGKAPTASALAAALSEAAAARSLRAGQEQLLGGRGLRGDVPLGGGAAHTGPGAMLDHLQGAGGSRVWRVREGAAARTALMSSRWMALWAGSGRTRLEAGLRKLLSDKQAEVRESAAAALRSACQSWAPADRRDAMDALVRQAAKGANAPAPPEDAAAGVKAAWQRARRLRLGGALGAGAILQTQPYDVPRWLPPFAAALARRGASDKQREVKQSVQKAFQEFRRTHASDWERES